MKNIVLLAFVGFLAATGAVADSDDESRANHAMPDSQDGATHLDETENDRDTERHTKEDRHSDRPNKTDKELGTMGAGATGTTGGMGATTGTNSIEE